MQVTNRDVVSWRCYNEIRALNIGRYVRTHVRTCVRTYFLSLTSTPLAPAMMHTLTMSMNSPCSTTPQMDSMALAAAYESLMGSFSKYKSTM